jgi:hypothetical protein
MRSFTSSGRQAADLERLANRFDPSSIRGHLSTDLLAVAGEPIFARTPKREEDKQ